MRKNPRLPISKPEGARGLSGPTELAGRPDSATGSRQPANLSLRVPLSEGLAPHLRGRRWAQGLGLAKEGTPLAVLDLLQVTEEQL